MKKEITTEAKNTCLKADVNYLVATPANGDKEKTIVMTFNSVKGEVDTSVLRSEGYVFVQYLYEHIASKVFFDGIEDGLLRIKKDRKEWKEIEMEEKKAEED